MHTRGQGIKVFAGNSNIRLARKVCDQLGLSIGKNSVSTFSDGEIAVNINETVRGRDVYIIQSVSPPKVNTYLMELLIMIDAMKRASAGRITAVIPYYGYARQDRKTKSRDPISAKLVANLLTEAGADRILTMDLHAPQIQGYFDIPLDHLVGITILTEYFKNKNIEDLVLVSPDLGSVTRTRDFAERLGVPLAIIDKRRPEANKVEVMNVVGDIEGKNVLLVDDMIDTAGTITNGANALRELGAKKVYACCTHGVFSGPAFTRINNSIIEELVTLDTIYNPKISKADKITSLSVAPIFAEAIKRIFSNESISVLFK